MPHKRKRSGSKGVQVSSDRIQTSSSRKRSKRLKALDKQERIPHELTRLLSYTNGIKPLSGLDEGEENYTQRQKPSQQNRATNRMEPDRSDSPKKSMKILPGEQLGDYSARVDAALPVGGLARKGKSMNVPGSRPYQTKLERKMQRMQKEWRLEDAKIKAQREEAAQELEDQLDDMLPGVGARHSAWGSKTKEDDPWADIGRSRKWKHETSRGLVGVHDVAHAPPQLKLARPKLKQVGSRPPDKLRSAS